LGCLNARVMMLRSINPPLQSTSLK
jgi:hypothetical protein